MKALVADDSMVSRRVLMGALTHGCGFDTIVEAEDGREAVKIAKEQSFDVIFLDWNMPKLLGIDALRVIRAAGLKVPVVMVTSVRDRENVVEAIAAGANNYIVKPYGKKTVMEKVNDTLTRAKERAQRDRTRRALVADDSKTIRGVLVKTLMGRCGFDHVVEAEDGDKAIELAKSQSFDLILLDWHMPNVEGIDALRSIRTTDKSTPVIMVTGNKEGERIIEAFDAGANNYLVKPFEVDDLVEKIEQVLHVHL